MCCIVGCHERIVAFLTGTTNICCLTNPGMINQSKKLTTANFSRHLQGFDVESQVSTKEDDDDHNGNHNGGSMETIHLKIPSEENERICSNCCAICLDPYQVDDIIVWSSSLSCHHVFHQECLVEGLSRAPKNEAPCPCCRIIFCNLPLEQRPGRHTSFVQRLQHQQVPHLQET